jgi:hypothetical protein
MSCFVGFTGGMSPALKLVLKLGRRAVPEIARLHLLNPTLDMLG